MDYFVPERVKPSEVAPPSQDHHRTRPRRTLLLCTAVADFASVLRTELHFSLFPSWIVLTALLDYARGCSSSEDSDDEVYLQNASDEDELGSSSGSMPKLQFRNMKSKGCWNEEMGMGEVIEKNGKMWVTTGIVRSGKIYSSIEETL
ncbi:hypothetical protein GmHk_19G055397 [Glycine max]|nr:hypothetical protein GmHk_19G055397 [Glycine max]